MQKENLWIIGFLIIVLGIFLLSLFMLRIEMYYFFSELYDVAGGFLIWGSITLFFGFLFTIICLDHYEKAEAKMDNTSKIRFVLTIVTTIYMILIGYLMYIDHEWTFKALIIEEFGQIFAFYPAFNLTSYDVMFATLVTFGIFVLPFVINELGFLDDYQNEQLENLVEEGQPIEKVKNQFDRPAGFLKRRIGPINKILNYTLPIGVSLTIVGSCFMGLPHFFILDSPLELDYKTRELFREVYQGFIRGQLFLIGILLLVIGIILIRQHFHSRQH